MDKIVTLKYRSIPVQDNLRFVTRVARRLPLVDEKLLALPEHMSSPRFLVLCVSFVDRYLSFYPFSHRLLLVMFETTNSRTQGSMHFVDTTKMCVNE